MQEQYVFDSLMFISQGGAVSVAVAASLAAMSIASWYLIVVKTLLVWRFRSGAKTFLTKFWASSSLETALKVWVKEKATPFSRLASQGIRAASHYRRHAVQRPGEACSHDEFIARAMSHTIGQESAKLERGLTVLASVGSVAPFIGLLGTVWGIYHALESIAASGQSTIDKVAGPVGEALIMTALGLAVAIPAVLAYNALVRSQRELMGEIEAFAHDLHAYLTTGAPLAAKRYEESVTDAVRSEAHTAEISA
ncbi:MAG: MotA/TolQ/ExbB proton channel family protein [Methylobacter sp.]|nr:MotA/TolQ/ExbB proton channel family protein [Methylobacter sp.]